MLLCTVNPESETGQFLISVLELFDLQAYFRECIHEQVNISFNNGLALFQETFGFICEFNSILGLMQNLLKSVWALTLIPIFWDCTLTLQVFAFTAFSYLAWVFREVPKLEWCTEKTVKRLSYILSWCCFSFCFQTFYFFIWTAQMITQYWKWQFQTLNDCIWEVVCTFMTTFSIIYLKIRYHLWNNVFSIWCAVYNTLIEHFQITNIISQETPWTKTFQFFNWGNQCSKVACKVDKRVGNEDWLKFLLQSSNL